MIEELYKIYCGCNYNVTTDSRQIKGGELFFALKGENFDGNAYALQALEKGAAYAVVNSSAGLPENERLIKVDDTLKTLGELAAWHRNNVVPGRMLPVIGLTGTNGKTTTKELITAVLSRKFKVCATQGNLNNDIGVPLSLLKITPETQIAVIEMGANHPDDIEKLVRVSQPDYGLITNVGRAHLLGFGSFDGVKSAKGALYRYLSSRDGSVVFLNNDDADLRQMAKDWVQSHIWPYGVRYDGARVLDPTEARPYLSIRLKDGKVLNTNLVGAYNASNAMAALAIGRYFGVPDNDALDAVASYVPVNNRSQMVRTSRNTVIVDAYNANPSSMAASIENFSSLKASRKVALLGDMRELGEESVSEHVKLLRMLIDKGIDAYLVGEEFCKASSVSSFKPLGLFDSSVALASYLGAHPLDGCAVLLKGSHSIGMEKLLEVL